MYADVHIIKPEIVTFLFLFCFEGVGISLLVSLSGSDTATVTEASLVALLGSEEVKGIVEPQDSRTFLVQVDKIPSVEFVVRVKGQDDSVTSSFKVFQRQSSTNFRPSNLTITVSARPKPSGSWEH